MIRIGQHRAGSTLNLHVEGSLSGSRASELERCWLDSKADADPALTVKVDLSSVTFIDDRGRELLKRMLADGAELRAAGVMTRAIVEELAAEINPNRTRL
ncbi:MAG TPA: hypothetical protein VLM38_04770 [Blastocatellia bacterium]|nr:hypothetical protein [Blastocatellia bacterium]